MYILNDMCFLCFVNNTSIKSVFLQDDDGLIVKDKLQYVFSEIVNFKPDVHKKICTDCLKDLNYVYKFKQKCIKNILHLRDYFEIHTPESNKFNSFDTSLTKEQHTVEIKDKTVDLYSSCQIKINAEETDDVKIEQNINDCIDGECSLFETIKNERFLEELGEIHHEIDIKDEPLLLEEDTKYDLQYKTIDTTGQSESEDEEISVQPAKNLNGKRMRDKGHSCYFCHKVIVNLARHLEIAHETETSVAKILAMPKNSEQRRKSFANILRAGDFYYNCEVLTAKKGELILARRPTEAESKFKTYSDYGPCPDCLGFLLKKKLWHHMKYNCTKKNILSTPDAKEKRYAVAESTALLNATFSTDFSKEYISNIVTKLRNDCVGHVCRNDSLIMQFGAMLFEKYGTTQNELLRQYMRQIGRLLLELKSNETGVNNLAQCLTPQKFDAVVQAAKNICGSQMQECQTPSLALKIGYALKNCVSVERGIALRSDDLKQNETLLSFLNLMESEWHTRISSNATLDKRNENQSADKKLNGVDIPDFEEEIKNAMDDTELDNDKKNIPNKFLDEATCSRNMRTSETPKTSSKNSGTSSKQGTVKMSWSTGENEAVLKYFKLAIKQERVPRKEECEKCVKNNDILASRKWTDVKFHVKNYISKKRKLKKK